MSNKKYTPKSIILRLLFSILLLATVTVSVVPGPVFAAQGSSNKQINQKHQVNPQPVTPPQWPTHPQPVGKIKVPKLPKNGRTTNALADNTLGGITSSALAAATTLPDHTSDPRAMRILIISANGNLPAYSDPDLPAIQAFLDQIGIPYDTRILYQFTPTTDPTTGNVTGATYTANPALTSSDLWDGVSTGKYQGIILTTGNLLFCSGYSDPQFTQCTGYLYGFDAVDPTQWQTLWNYEAMFGVRQVTAFTYPGSYPDSYGLQYFGEVSTTISNPLKATLTADGKTVFPYLNSANPITIINSYTYLGIVAPSEVNNVTPLLTTPCGTNDCALAAIKDYPDGRENLALTVDNNPFLVHSLLLSYGVINWVTKGVFTGSRHVTLDVQPDDLFIEDDIWDSTALTDTTGLSFRMSGTDFTNFINWQKNTRGKYPLASKLTIEWPFNAEGTTGIYSPDTLTKAVISNQANFNYINHTYTHANLDGISYADATAEISQNNNWAKANLKGNLYSKQSMVQPDISGLYATGLVTTTGVYFQQAAVDAGIKYIISDYSRPEWRNPSPNTGIISTIQPSLLIIPRRTSNLFYNLRTPDQWVSEYNCYYGPNATCAGGTWKFWDHNLTYQQILDQESNNWLQYLLMWDIDPMMFHQPNAGSYSGSNSLLGDLLGATLAKYSAMYKLPIVNKTEVQVGADMANRMAYNASGLTAVLYPGQQIVLTTVNAATIPVTGVKIGTTTETYGNQAISSIKMNAGQSLTFVIPTNAGV